MIFKCIYCGSRVKFDIEKQLMRCESCGRLADEPEVFGTEYIFDMYRCSSCGSLLNINEEEVTSECPYCGTQSVVYEGKNENFKPEYIIPFKVTLNNAVSIIKEEFSGYHFTPKGIKKFNIECIRPIYVPFWINSINIGTKQVIRGTKTVMKEEITYQYRRTIRLNYDNICVNESKRFSERVAIRLEPWYMKDERNFNPMYISGLYAGVDDAEPEKAEQAAVSRAREFIDRKVMDSCNETKSNEVVECGYKQSINDRHLSLLPVWFFTANYKGKKYAAVVNGQTGKVVSAVPFFKSVFFCIAAAITAVVYFPSYYIYYFLINFINAGSSKAIYFLLMFVMMTAVVGVTGYNKYIEYKKTLKAFNSVGLINYVENRRK